MISDTWMDTQNLPFIYFDRRHLVRIGLLSSKIEKHTNWTYVLLELYRQYIDPVVQEESKS